MKKTFFLLSVMVLSVTLLVWAADPPKPGLRPAQVIMQARAAWLTAIVENLGAAQWDGIVRNADALADQTQKTGENHPNPQGKEITLAIAALAKDLSANAMAQDTGAVKAKLEGIQKKCGECHDKFREKR